MMTLTGRACVVVGSAPLAAPIVLSADEFVVGVNGGVSSVPRVDAWVVNSRNNDAAAWSPAQRRLSKLMLAQAAGRTIPLAVFLSKHDEGPPWTLKFLKGQKTTVGRWIALNGDERRAMETAVGARTRDLAKHALSAGLTAAAWCFSEGAETVRLEGISWTTGYQYLPGEVIPVRAPAQGGRGHAHGDKEAIRLLTGRYPGRLLHSLISEVSQMATKKTAPQRPPRDPEAGQRARDAKDALSPAGERERKLALKQQQKAAAAAAARPDSALMVRATELTYYHHKRRRLGDVFPLREESDFRESCMEWVDPNTPETPHIPFDANRAPVQLEPDGVTPKPRPPAAQGGPSPENPLGVE
jgi:hypothetical protein